jgi:hypothetical protein
LRWIVSSKCQIERTFDTSCDRWRSLYRSAVRQRELHHNIIGDHARPEAERNHSRRLRAQAENQIRLLTEAEGVYEGDFYSYRMTCNIPYSKNNFAPRVGFAYSLGEKSATVVRGAFGLFYAMTDLLDVSQGLTSNGINRQFLFVPGPAFGNDRRPRPSCDLK